MQTKNKEGEIKINFASDFRQLTDTRVIVSLLAALGDEWDHAIFIFVTFLERVIGRFFFVDAPGGASRWETMRARKIVTRPRRSSACESRELENEINEIKPDGESFVAPLDDSSPSFSHVIGFTSGLSTSLWHPPDKSSKAHLTAERGFRHPIVVDFNFHAVVEARWRWNVTGQRLLNFLRGARLQGGDSQNFLVVVLPPQNGKVEITVIAFIHRQRQIWPQARSEEASRCSFEWIVKGAVLWEWKIII